MKCEKDVAGLLANISSVDGKLPTGSCLSQILAYYSHKKMFDDLSELANRNNLNISVYVDDIAISGRKASNRVMYEAIKIIKKSGLETRRSKVRRYKRGKPKLVTGVIVTESSIKLPNSRHLKLHQAKKTLLRELRSKIPVKNINSLNGMIVSAQQIDPQLQFKRIK